MENKPLWHDDVSRFLSTHAPAVAPEVITALIQSNTVRWETPVDNGQTLTLLRLSHPVIDREKIFVGNVLFNDWLNKSLPVAIEQAGLGDIQPITNDLEAAYFLVISKADLPAIAEACRTYLLAELTNLFFSDNDPERGYHGSFQNMFSFFRSDREPFPVYAVPIFLARDLENAVRNIFTNLLKKPLLQSDGKKIKPSLNLHTVGAIMALFYGRTSSGDGDSQSYRTFIARLVTEYKLLTLDEVSSAFRITLPDAASIDQKKLKGLIEDSIKKGLFDEQKVKELFMKAHTTFTESVDEETSDDVDLMQSWFLPFVRRDGKLVDLAPVDYLASLLHRVTIGELTLGLGVIGGERCRFCGDQEAVISEKSILAGVSVKRFYNRRANYPQNHDKRLCPRCSIYSYLTVKVVGSISKGDLPIPKLGNIIFHYGQYTPAEIQALQKRIGYLIDTIKERNAVRYQYLSSSKEEVKKQWNSQKEKEVVEAKLIELLEQENDNSLEIERLSQRLTEFFEETKKLGAVEALIPNANVIHVLDLGLGQWRLVAFAMGQLRDEKELAQKRFVAGRLQVYSLLSFLQLVSQEDPESSGPYYFQSIPQLGDQSMAHRDTFYVRDRPVPASRYRRLYQTVSIFAHGVTRTPQRGGGRTRLTETLKLAAALEKSPLETFSAVLRDSPFRAKDDLREGEYQVFKDQDEDRLELKHALGVYDGWPYLGAYYALKEIAETE